MAIEHINFEICHFQTVIILCLKRRKYVFSFMLYCEIVKQFEGIYETFGFVVFSAFRPKPTSV